MIKGCKEKFFINQIFDENIRRLHQGKKVFRQKNAEKKCLLESVFLTKNFFSLMKTSDIFVENLVNKKLLLAAFYHLTYQMYFVLGTLPWPPMPRTFGPSACKTFATSCWPRCRVSGSCTRPGPETTTASRLCSARAREPSVPAPLMISATGPAMMTTMIMMTRILTMFMMSFKLKV